MNSNRANFQNISVGIFILVIAASLIVIGVTGLSLLFVFPVVFLVMGIWICAAAGPFYVRAWGVALAVGGGLWLVQWIFHISLYVTAGIFLAALGVLVIVGSRK
jgi:hypothetical protein